MNEQQQSVLAWHLLMPDMRAANGSEEPWRDGETREIAEQPVLCRVGYHGCPVLLDALGLAGGTVICRVRLSGKRVNDARKIAAQRRKLLWHIEPKRSERLLDEFACWCAEQALLAERKAGREPEPRSWDAITVKRRWLMGKATTGKLAAVRGAATGARIAAYAAEAAARTAGTAADGAGTAAAYAAAYAAEAAADELAAAGAAAGAAAYAAADAAGAAEAAGRAADAARNSQSRELLRAVMEARRERG